MVKCMVHNGFCETHMCELNDSGKCPVGESNFVLVCNHCQGEGCKVCNQRGIESVPEVAPHLPVTSSKNGEQVAPQVGARPFGGMCEGRPDCKNPAMPGDFICLECAAHMLGDKW